KVALGEDLMARDRRALADRMAEIVIAMIDRRAADDLMRHLLVTEPWPAYVLDEPIDAMTFSGGVAEYLYGRETARFGDLGYELAHDLRHALAHRKGGAAVWDPGQGIRATVIGAAQFSVQISGNTITIADPEKLPLQNLPVMACAFQLNDTISPNAIAAGECAAQNHTGPEEDSEPVRRVVPHGGRQRWRRVEALCRWAGR